jgi:hypothetical protein
MLRQLLLPAASVAVLAFATAAYAHGGNKPEHGGVVQVAGDTLFELVSEPGGVSLFVEDDEEEVDSAAMTAKLTITDKSGASSEAVLTPAGGNRFQAQGVTIPAGATVGVLLVNKATQAQSTATFSPK